MRPSAVVPTEGRLEVMLLFVQAARAEVSASATAACKNSRRALPFRTSRADSQNTQRR
jgi:hypothetical protein